LYCPRSSDDYGKRPGESIANDRDRSSKYFIVGQWNRYAHLQLTAAILAVLKSSRLGFVLSLAQQGTSLRSRHLAVEDFKEHAFDGSFFAAVSQFSLSRGFRSGSET